MINESHTVQGRGAVVSTGAFQWQQLQICSWLYLSVSYSRLASCKQNIIKPALCITLTQQKRWLTCIPQTIFFCISFSVLSFLEYTFAQILTLYNIDTSERVSPFGCELFTCIYYVSEKIFLNGIRYLMTQQNPPKIQFRIASVSYFSWQQIQTHAFV